MQSQNELIDWTGVQPDRSPMEPLNEKLFSLRLRRLGERAESLTILRRAFTQQQANGQQLSRNSEPASRQSR